jgi:magnesium transporter
MTLKLHRTQHDQDPKWITATDPSAEEQKRLYEEFHFQPEVIAHSLDLNEWPRVRIFGKSIFIVMRVPHFEGRTSDIPYRTIPIGIFLGEPCGLTICRVDCDIVQELAAYTDQNLSQLLPHKIALYALERTGFSYLQHLDVINRTVDTLEGRLKSALENREVLELLKYQKSLVYFTAALDGMHEVLEKIHKLSSFLITEQDEQWLEDVQIEYRQALETSTLSKDVMSEMMDAFASIISNNLNVVMKFLASITVILTLPVAVASFYGMNVLLPGQHSPNAFLGTILFSILISIILTILFKRRGWL